MRARTLLTLVTIALLTTLGILAAGARPAAAHNTLVATDPPSGAALDVAPRQATFTFKVAVPLETATVQLIDGSGARTELAGLTHGPGGDTELVAPLPALGAGEITLRWRLVGPDGHPLTDRLTFTIRAATSTTTAPSAAVLAPPSSLGPTTTTASVSAVDAADDTPARVPGFVRWLLRAGSYLAIMTMVGIVATDALVWPGALAHGRLGRFLRLATVVVLATGALQLLVLASDVAGGVPGLDDLEVAGRTPAGGALVLRLLFGAFAAALLQRPGAVHPETRWSVLFLLGAGLLGTWAFAGHAASQRWPHVGVTLDIVHHLAAALWIGSLAVVGLVATDSVEPRDLTRMFARLSQWAGIAVAALVATGLAQTVRLVGGPSNLLGTGHGRYLVLKLTVLVAMLVVANANRRHVHGRLTRSENARHELAQLRRGIVSELALGLVIIGVTAAMVVAPPGTA